MCGDMLMRRGSWGSDDGEKRALMGKEGSEAEECSRLFCILQERAAWLAYKLAAMRRRQGMQKRSGEESAECLSSAPASLSGSRFHGASVSLRCQEQKLRVTKNRVPM